ncbi:MAG: copper resistance protein CopC [Solirubrobacteraceae bacterium]
MRPTRTLAVTAAVAAVGLTAAPAAFGHAEVKQRTPGPGKTVSKVRTVKVTFSESVVTGLITVTRGGTTVKPAKDGLAPKNHAVLRARFAKPLPNGRYTVNWRSLADDGHRQSGSWSFTVR